MYNSRDNDVPVIPVLGLAALIFSLSLIPRFFDIVMWLPQYWIDENEIVEYSIAFLGGDIKPRFYGYGPLYAYILSLLNFAWMKFQGLDYIQYARDIFFEPTRFYLLARITNSLLNISLALIGFFITRAFFGKLAAIAALPLLVFPFADMLVQFSVRIDTLLAVFANLAILAALRILRSGKTAWYVLCGILFGLSVATKPLPGLLVLPAIVLAHFFNLHNQQCLTDCYNQKTLRKKIYSVLATVIFNARLYYFFASAFLANFIANPYSVLDINQYLRTQASIVLHEETRQYEYGFDITRFFDSLGYAFVIFSVIAVLYIAVQGIRRRSQMIAVLLAYPLVYYLVFASGPARDYWYVTLIPVLCACSAKLITDFTGSFSMVPRQIMLLLLPVILITQPFLALARDTLFRNEFAPYHHYHTSLAGKSWIEDNIRPEISIILSGWPTDLPRIVDIRAREQAMIGQYFMYQRDKNRPYTGLFTEVHSDYVREGNPAYYLTHVGPRCNRPDAVSTLKDMISSGEYDYLITQCDIRETIMPLPELVRHFGRPGYPYGTPFWIFKLD